jgi:diguanylate cyclase (GGDEF)-like protein/PAS domain S-box-containing protein
MSLQVDYYVLSLFFGALVAGAVAVVAWRRTATSMGRSLVLLMGSVFVWSFLAAFEAAVPATATKILLSKVEYLGIASTPVLMFLFALKFSRSGSRLKKGRAAALWIIPVLTLLLAATNEAHGLIWSGFSPAPVGETRLLLYQHGTFFWVHVGYSYLLLFATTVLLLLAYFRFKGIHRRQAVALLLSFPWPWLGNALYLAGLAGGKSGHDFTPVGFAIAGFFLLGAMFRLQLVDIVPVAREQVVESMGESLIILDEGGRVAATNPAARQLIAEAGGPAEDVRESELLGRPVADLFPAWPEMAAGLSAPSASQREIPLRRDGSPRVFEVRLSPLLGHGTYVTGWVAVLYDITRLKEAESSAVEARNVAETLREAGLTLSSKLEFSQVSAVILDIIKRVVPFDIGAFLTTEGAELKLAGIKGPADTQDWIGRTFPMTGCQLCNTAVQGMRPLISKISNPEDILLPLSAEIGVHSYLGVPVVFRDHVTGLIALYNSGERPFTEADARVAELFANQVAIALDNSRRVEQMEHQAVTDQLTGLYNRRAFADMAEKEVGRARRYQRPLALILFDIDHFKNVNDTHGHLVGDQVLRILTEKVTKTTRSTDFVCRYGGEEFIVLMPEAGREEALAMAERLREMVSGITVVAAEGTLSMTISLGVAALGPGEDETLEGLIGRADKAMYEAKAAGRNTVRG